MASKKLRTPIIKPRTQGGTFYTFCSSLEDVGLNINELKNKVALSHYVLLNIPEFAKDESLYGTVTNPGDYTFAAQLENYALNMESVVRNQSSYNFSASRTISERVFWKFMQKYCALNFTKEEDSGYYVDSSDIIQGFGQITAGAQRSDAYGIYNETFVQIPSSYGKMKVLFSPVQDTNYYIKENGYKASSTDGYIENIGDDEIDEEGLLHTGITASALYDNNSTHAYNVSSEKDELCAVFSLSDLRAYYEDPSLTYDDIGIDSSVEQYNFNAILVYYSIYDSTGINILATNAYGLLILDSAISTATGKYEFPSIVKKKTTAASSGLSYAFRINIKASSVYSGDIVVEDESTGGYTMGSEFNDVIRNLDSAVETLRSNANVIATISSDNQTIKKLAMDAIDKIDSLEKDIANLKNGTARKINASSIIADTAEINSLKGGVSIYDEDGNVVGELGTEMIDYNDASIGSATIGDLESDNITAKNVLVKDDELQISDESGAAAFAKINQRGVHSEASFFSANPSETSSDTPLSGAVTFLNGLKVHMDTQGHITIGVPEKSETSDPTILEAIADKNAINISNLLYVVLAAVKELSDRDE